MTGGVTIYTLSNCSTCRDAVRWLTAHRISFREKAIRDTPPRLTELRAMLAAQPGELRRLCNVTGLEYRKLGLAQKLPRMAEAEALALLAGNGRLVKRPFLVGPGVALVGFDPAAWSAMLAGR